MDNIKVTVPSEMYLSDLDCFHPGVLADAGFAIGYDKICVGGGVGGDMTTTPNYFLLSPHQKKAMEQLLDSSSTEADRHPYRNGFPVP